ncbi:MAG TPA: sulfite exporter TauE/SafE family protein [Steroidobacteraceae bacterium]|nr:sulfite exporter TauE/SafE family protein [Steroidobacteraceae bacterium]HNS28046.1 sulfite exporter TauE/SafE family protein [Steroidobacteraceae bacterium]
MEALPAFALALAGTGLVAGLIAGLLGVGGGIVIVPVLDAVLIGAGVAPEWSMNVAVATSLATIVPTSIASARAHHARGAVNWPLARRWGGPIVAGAFVGGLLAARASSAGLAALFGIVAAVVATRMFLPFDHLRLAPSPPRGLPGAATGTGIGALSAMLGIGGGTLAVPALTLAGEPIHRAVATAAFFGLLVSGPGTLAYLLALPAAELPPGTVGLVNLPGVALIALATIVTVPLGARIAHALGPRALSMAFGAFLLMVAARMLWRVIVV